MKNRNNNSVDCSLLELKNAIDNKSNLLPLIINAVKNNCTLGEICELLRKKYGEHF